MVDYEKRESRRNKIVGVFVILGIAALMWMVFLLGEMPIFVNSLSSFKIVTYFDSASGIQANSPVDYCGYQIGRVKKVYPPSRITGPGGVESHYVKIDVLIEKNYSDIPADSEIRIVKRGLGSSFVEIDEGVNKQDYIANGDILWGNVVIANEFFSEEVSNNLEEMVSSLGELIGNVNVIVGDKDNQHNIQQTLKHVTELTSQAQNTLKSIESFADTGRDVLKNADTTVSSISTEISNVSSAFNDAVKGLGTAVDEVKITLNKLNNGNGTASRLLEDPTLYENLIDGSKELQAALQELKNLAEDARQNGLKIKW